MVAYGFCHYSDKDPVVGWEAIRPKINKLTKEQARRLEYRESAAKLRKVSDNLIEQKLAGSEISWDEVTEIQTRAAEYENKALGR